MLLWLLMLLSMALWEGQAFGMVIDDFVSLVKEINSMFGWTF